MTKLVVQGKNIEITPAIRSYVTQKIEKTTHHFAALINEVDVYLSVSCNGHIAPHQTAEVTVYLPHAVIRAEEDSDNLYASIDQVTPKLQRQLRKYKDKKVSPHHASVRMPSPEVALAVDSTPDISQLLAEKQAQLPDEVVRVRYFEMPPMTVQEALAHLEQVGHDFYMFHNAATGDISVAYKRNHGGFGLLQERSPSHRSANTSN